MAVSYNRLWKLLIDRGMKKRDLAEMCELTSNTMTQLRNDISVHLRIIENICDKLGCKIEDVVEIKIDNK